MSLLSAIATRRFVVPAALVTTAGAVALPLAVHLLPPVGATPMGAVLLPLFIAPFVAAYVFHPAAALVAAVVTPLLNRALTGQPAPQVAAMLTIELCAFVLAALLLRRAWPRFIGNAPLALVAAKVVAAGVLSVTALLPAPPVSYFTNSVVNGLPGLALLVVVNYLVVRFVGRGAAPRPNA